MRPVRPALSDIPELTADLSSPADDEGDSQYLDDAGNLRRVLPEELSSSKCPRCRNR